MNNDKETTFNELLEACLTQNEIHRVCNEAEVTTGQMQHEIEVLRKLHTYAMCRRRFKELEHLKQKIHGCIKGMVESLED